MEDSSDREQDHVERRAEPDIGDDDRPEREMGSERQKMLELINPLSRRMKFKTPKSPDSTQFQIALTTRLGMTQETRNRPRSQEAPGKFTQKNSAKPKPIRN